MHHADSRHYDALFDLDLVDSHHALPTSYHRDLSHYDGYPEYNELHSDGFADRLEYNERHYDGIYDRLAYNERYADTIDDELAPYNEIHSDGIEDKLDYNERHYDGIVDELEYNELHSDALDDTQLYTDFRSNRNRHQDDFFNLEKRPSKRSHKNRYWQLLEAAEAERDENEVMKFHHGSSEIARSKQ